MTFNSSNKKWVESLTTKQVIEHIRLAMSEGCIKPAHVYDLVDEALHRLWKESAAGVLNDTMAEPINKDCGKENRRCPLGHKKKENRKWK